MGDRVVAGEVLGHPSLKYEASDGISDIGMSELLVYSPDSRCWCPFSLFDDTLKTSWQAKVSALMQDWEDYIDNYDSTHGTSHKAVQYDLTLQTECPGCAAEYYEP